MSAQQIEPLARTEIFADREIEGCAVAGKQGRGPAAVVHDVPGVAGKQKDVAGFQLQRPAFRRILQGRRASEHGMVRDFIRLTGSLVGAMARRRSSAGRAARAPASSRKVG